MKTIYAIGIVGLPSGKDNTNCKRVIEVAVYELNQVTEKFSERSSAVA